MDIVERLAQQAAELINGGEFNDGKWYTEGQRQAWRKAMTPVADEIERLRQQNAELRKLVENHLRSHSFAEDWDAPNMEKYDALAKATGGE